MYVFWGSKGGLGIREGFGEADIGGASGCCDEPSGGSVGYDFSDPGGGSGVEFGFSEPGGGFGVGIRLGEPGGGSGAEYNGFSGSSGGCGIGVLNEPRAPLAVPKGASVFGL
jgi:hypothetical protein